MPSRPPEPSSQRQRPSRQPASAACRASCADLPAASAFVSTSPMRASFFLVRSCVSSTCVDEPFDLPVDRAHFAAHELLRGATRRSRGEQNDRNHKRKLTHRKPPQTAGRSLLSQSFADRAGLPGHVPAAGLHGVVLLADLQLERMPALSSARLEPDQILVAQLLDDAPRDGARLRRRGIREELSTGPACEIRQGALARRILPDLAVSVRCSADRSATRLRRRRPAHRWRSRFAPPRPGAAGCWCRFRP